MKERSVIMNEGNRRMELLGSAPIPKALLAMGLPAMIGMMINALYNLVDAYFVGGLGTSQMGAISVAFPLGQIVAGAGAVLGGRRGSLCSGTARPPIFLGCWAMVKKKLRTRLQAQRCTAVCLPVR